MTEQVGPLTLSVNGEELTVAHGATVMDLVRTMTGGGGADGRGSAVALNGAVVARSRWQTTPLDPGDQIEVLTAVAGG